MQSQTKQTHLLVSNRKQSKTGHVFPTAQLPAPAFDHSEVKVYPGDSEVKVYPGDVECEPSEATPPRLNEIPVLRMTEKDMELSSQRDDTSNSRSRQPDLEQRRLFLSLFRRSIVGEIEILVNDFSYAAQFPYKEGLQDGANSPYEFLLSEWTALLWRFDIAQSANGMSLDQLDSMMNSADYEKLLKDTVYLKRFWSEKYSSIRIPAMESSKQDIRKQLAADAEVLETYRKSIQSIDDAAGILPDLKELIDVLRMAVDVLPVQGGFPASNPVRHFVSSQLEVLSESVQLASQVLQKVAIVKKEQARALVKITAGLDIPGVIRHSVGLIKKLEKKNKEIEKLKSDEWFYSESP